MVVILEYHQWKPLLVFDLEVENPGKNYIPRLASLSLFGSYPILTQP